MRFRATLEETATGEFVASCTEPSASATGLSPQNALDQLRRELRYWVELCPCSGVSDDYVELEVEE